jgi:hypothetical protein
MKSSYQRSYSIPSTERKLAVHYLSQRNQFIYEDEENAVWELFAN